MLKRGNVKILVSETSKDFCGRVVSSPYEKMKGNA